MKLAIDIGSNTIKCLLGEPENRGVRVLYEESLDWRICGGSSALVPDAAEIISRAIVHFKIAAKKFSPTFETVAVATSALREATERDAVISAVFGATGEKIEILSGEDEARLSYAGAVSGLDNPAPCLYFDLGGGSLELVYGDGRAAQISRSLKLGAVRLTREFFGDSEPTPETLAKLRAKAEAALRQAAGDFPKIGAVVCAGGAVVAARLLKKRLWLAGAEDEITLADMELLARLMRESTLAERVEKYAIPPRRADIICAAFETVLVLMRVFGVEKIKHTFFNLRYGIILSDIK